MMSIDKYTVIIYFTYYMYIMTLWSHLFTTKYIIYKYAGKMIMTREIPNIYYEISGNRGVNNIGY